MDDDQEPFKEINQEIEFNGKSMNIKEKIIWTFKIWFGFKQKIKVKRKFYR